MIDFTAQMVRTNGIQLACELHGPPLSEPGVTTLILTHGLTANRFSFHSLIRAGLADDLRVVLVDLRGRGDSDKPASGYHMADHAADILGLMDALDLETVVMGGHSFGGLLSLYMGAYHADRLTQLVVIDAGLEATRPEVLPKIKPSLERLGRILPSADAYISAIRQSPYYADGFWTDDLEAYYRADLEDAPDGVRARIHPENIQEAVEKIIETDWHAIITRLTLPTLLIHAPAPLGPPGSSPILTEAGAQEMRDLLRDCTYVPVAGHHITMVFGPNAPQVVQAIRGFIG